MANNSGTVHPSGMKYTVMMSFDWEKFLEYNTSEKDRKNIYRKEVKKGNVPAWKSSHLWMWGHILSFPVLFQNKFHPQYSQMSF